MYRDGDGATQDLERAFFWMRKAAEKTGHPCLQRQFGPMYEHRRGVARDMEQAGHWDQRVADQNGYFERSQMTDLQPQIARHDGGYRSG